MKADVFLFCLLAQASLATAIGGTVGEVVAGSGIAISENDARTVKAGDVLLSGEILHTTVDRIQVRLASSETLSVAPNSIVSFSARRLRVSKGSVVVRAAKGSLQIAIPHQPNPVELKSGDVCEVEVFDEFSKVAFFLRPVAACHLSQN